MTQELEIQSWLCWERFSCRAEAKQHWPRSHGWDLLSESCPVPQPLQLHAPSAQPRCLLSKISCSWQLSAELWLPASLWRGPWAASPNLCLLAGSCLAMQYFPSPLLGTWGSSCCFEGFVWLCLPQPQVASCFWPLSPAGWGKWQAEGLSILVPKACFQEQAKALPGRMLLIPQTSPSLACSQGWKLPAAEPAAGGVEQPLQRDGVREGAMPAGTAGYTFG